MFFVLELAEGQETLFTYYMFQQPSTYRLPTYYTEQWSIGKYILGTISHHIQVH